MVQVLPELNPRRTFGADFGRSLGQGFSEGLGFGAQLGIQQQQEREKEKKAQEIESLRLQKRDKGLKDLFGVDFAGVPDDLIKPYIQEITKSQQKRNLFSEILKMQQNKSFSDEIMSPQQQAGMEGRGEDLSQFGDSSTSPYTAQNPPHNSEEIQAMSFVDPTTANIWQRQNEDWRRNQEHKEKIERALAKEERAYHTQFSKPQRDIVEGIRNTLPSKSMSLDFAREAVETGNPNYFSFDKLADITGVDAFRTAKGAQLLTAGKENLLSNMERASAKAQNIWFEQRLNSMFPKIGQSQEANLTTQEMLEGEVALTTAYLNEYDRLSEEDEKNYGFERKDLNKRTRNNIKDKEREIFNRTSYRIKEIEEKEKGLQEMKKSVGKNVVKGTPLTFAMAELYEQKFGDNALAIAKKNGYTIPSTEDFKIYASRPREYRESLSQ
jgi:hypothetical protein